MVDPVLYLSLAQLAQASGGILPADMQRQAMGRQGKLGSDSLVMLFPADRAMMPATTGAVDMGTIHHARLYAWPGKRGGYEFAVLRVWLADLAVCGLLRPRVDVLSVDLPNWSQSWRQATPKLVRAVQAGSARYLGWLVPGDEIEFPTVDVIPGTGQIRSFLQDFPERHWVIKSFEQPTVVSLGPSYLAEEGLTSVAGLSDEATKVITRSWRPAVATLFSCRELVVVRRTALGQPRWHDGGSHLPLSWRPWQRAAEALG